MAKIFFICGFIGSGKTTYSTELSNSAPAFRFSLDEWMIPLYGEHMERDVFDTRINILQNLFKDAALRLLNLNTSIVFDFGFWKKSDRDEIIKWAKQHGLNYEMIYLNTAYDTCCERAYARNKDRGENAYEMTPEMMSLFWSWFETPTKDERCTYVENN